MAGAPDYGSLLGYLNQPGGADVAGGGIDLGSLFGQGGGGLGGLGSLFGQGGGGLGGLGSLFGQGGAGMIPGLGSITNLMSGIQNLMQGGVGGDVTGAADITGALVSLIPGIGQVLGPAIAGLGNIIGPMVQGLPGNVKPEMFANYLQSQGGLAGDLGSLIANAQQAAGSTGVLSQSGAGAYNPNFEAGLLEALTGQNLGQPNAAGKIAFNAPPSGGAKQGVSMNFADAQNILQQLGMTSGEGFTAQQLSSPKAVKAIMSATKGGKVGTGEGKGAAKIGDYLPKVVAALEKVGIMPGGGLSSTGTGDGSGGGGSTGVGGPGDYLNQPKSGDTTGTPDLTGLLKFLSNLIPGLGGQGGGGGTGIGYGGQGGSATASPTINIQAPKQAPWLQAAGGFTPGGMFSPLPKI